MFLFQLKQHAHLPAGCCKERLFSPHLNTVFYQITPPLMMKAVVVFKEFMSLGCALVLILP